MDRVPRAHVALFLVNLIYGANYVVAKGLMPEVIGPSGFILLRISGAGLLFWLLRAFRPEKVDLADAWRLVLCAFTGVALNQLCFFHGLMRTAPVNASIIMVVTPILVLVMSALLIGERITHMKLGGILLGAAGALFLLLMRNEASIGASLGGDLFIVVNATSYAVFLVMVKPLMRKYSAITVMAWTFLIGWCMVLPLGLADVRALQWAQWDSGTWWAVGFVVVAVTFAAYLLNTWALRVVNPSVVGTYIYLQPLLAAVFGWLNIRYVLQGEAGWEAIAGPVQLLSALAIFTGVHLVNRSDAQRRR